MQASKTSSADARTASLLEHPLGFNIHTSDPLASNVKETNAPESFANATFAHIPVHRTSESTGISTSMRLIYHVSTTVRVFRLCFLRSGSLHPRLSNLSLPAEFCQNAVCAEDSLGPGPWLPPLPQLSPSSFSRKAEHKSPTSGVLPRPL